MKWIECTSAEMRWPVEVSTYVFFFSNDGVEVLNLAAGEAPPDLKEKFPAPQEVFVKIIGGTHDAHVRAEQVAQLGFRVERTLEREPGTEIRLYPALKRLLVERPNQLPIKKQPLKVLIIDDSKTIRSLLRQIISADPEMTVVGEVERPTLAASAVETLKPDVITLDVHMPEMDGVTLLKTILVRYNIPTVMISSISIAEGPQILDALEHGAVDYIQKPSYSELPLVAPQIVDKVKTAARANLKRTRKMSVRTKQAITAFREDIVVAIGASTGGTEAIKSILVQLPTRIPPIVIVQHIPPVFSKAFADRLNGLVPFEVREAMHGDEVKPGLVLIAPGGRHMEIERRGGRLLIVLSDTPAVNRHRPSVDVMMDSVADVLGAGALGILLTGMGVDGARGLLRMRKKGAKTLAQDEASSVVFGMPKEALRIGAADSGTCLGEIPERMLQLLSGREVA